MKNAEDSNFISEWTGFVFDWIGTILMIVVIPLAMLTLSVGNWFLDMGIGYHLAFTAFAPVYFTAAACAWYAITKLDQRAAKLNESFEKELTHV